MRTSQLSRCSQGWEVLVALLGVEPMANVGPFAQGGGVGLMPLLPQADRPGSDEYRQVENSQTGRCLTRGLPAKPIVES